MGELLICHEPIAAMPFYVEGAGINLYSMEELCYYIGGNTYLLDKNFMCEELCTWIEHQMGLFKLAEELRSFHSIAAFAEAILRNTGYYSDRETDEIVLSIRQMEEKTDFECKKLRADRLMENRKYIGSIYEYRRLLDAGETRNASALMVGAIWHNLGTAYARLFLFQEAVSCYEKAYDLNQSRESMRAGLLCCLCMQDEKSFLAKAADRHLDDIAIQELRTAFGQAGAGAQAQSLKAQLAEVSAMEQAGQKAQAKQEITEMIFVWKEDYRRSSRV